MLVVHITIETCELSYALLDTLYILHLIMAIITFLIGKITALIMMQTINNQTQTQQSGNASLSQDKNEKSSKYLIYKKKKYFMNLESLLI